MSRRGKLLVILLIVLLFAGIAAAGLLLRVKEVQVAGQSHFSSEEIEALVLPEGLSRSPLAILAKKLFGGYSYPQFESCSVSLNGLTAATVQVKEKRLYGYVPHFGSNLFFDKDGVVLKSSADSYPDVIKVSGLQVETAVLNEPLKVENEKNFKLVATVIDFLATHQITLDNVTMYLYAVVDEASIYDGASVSLKMGDVTVLLGKNVDLQEKLLDLVATLPQVWGRSGTLHMEEYAGADTGHVYYFEDR